MKRVTSHLDYDGHKAMTIVTQDHILVRVDDTACLAHRRWFDRDEAAEMIESLRAFISTKEA